MKKTNFYRSTLRTSESFIGESLEEKIRRTTESNTPIDAVSPMYYNERKDGVQAGTNIRTDKWDIALNAMTSISDGVRNKRQEKIMQQSKELKSDKPNTAE